MYRTLLIVSLLTTFNFIGFSQAIEKYDRLSRERAELILSTCLKDEIKNRNHLLFSNGDIGYLIITENETKYNEYYLYRDTIEHKSSMKTIIVNKPNRILSIAFDTAQYHKEFINFNSEFYSKGYTKAWGANTYFFFKTKEGEKYGECRLSVIVDPNPINKELYNYLQLKLIKYIAESTNRKQIVKKQKSDQH